MLAPVRTVAPVLTPVSLADAKAHLVVEHSDHDSYVEALIAAATAHLDGWGGILGRALVEQTWTQVYPCFRDPLRLPLAPVSSVSEITYFDGDNVSQTLSTDVYRRLVDARGPYVARKPDQDWPGTYAREDAVTVTYVAGYGDTGASVPAAIRQAMLLMIGHWYQNREAVVVGQTPAQLPMAADALLAPYRRVGF